MCSLVRIHNRNLIYASNFTAEAITLTFKIRPNYWIRNVDGNFLLNNQTAIRLKRDQHRELINCQYPLKYGLLKNDKCISLQEFCPFSARNTSWGSLWAAYQDKISPHRFVCTCCSARSNNEIVSALFWQENKIQNTPLVTDTNLSQHYVAYCHDINKAVTLSNF